VNDPFITQFPGLAVDGYRVTSPATDRYNCIAWAASRTDRWWWPTPDGFWPPNAPVATTLEAFEAAYASLGFVRCLTARFELRFEKITIFVNVDGTPTHAARQLTTGRWTSKLGRNVDIEHATPDALAGLVYGRPVLLMCRPRPLWRWPATLTLIAYNALCKVLRSISKSFVQ
jgi:hypothetical protein